MARGSQFVVDLNVIETECENFKNCSSKYQNNTHSYFKNSYLTKCTDIQIKRAVSKISTYYENVKKDYEEIYKWWKSYIDNVNGLENYLSNQGLSTLSEQSLINFLKGSLEELESYNFDIEIAYGSFNKQAGTYNSGTDKINKLNNTNTSNYKNNLNGSIDTQSLNKNKNATNQSSSFNNGNFSFGDIGFNYGGSNSSLNNGEVTFNDIFGNGAQGNNTKNGSANIAGFDIGSKIKSFFNSIEVLSDNTFNKSKKYSVQKSSIGFGATAAAFGLGAMGSRRSNKKTSAETTSYGQGNYKGSVTDTNNNSNNNSSFANTNSFKNKDSYLNAMNTQNIEIGNTNFNFKNIVDISKKIIGLIKSIATNSIIICNTNGVNYQTSKSDVKATGAKVGEANSVDLANKVEYLKTNTSLGHRTVGVSVFSQSKKIVKLDNIKNRKINGKNILSKDLIGTKLNKNFKEYSVPKFNVKVSKTGDVIKIAKDIATTKAKETVNTIFNDLNILLSKFSNKDFLEKNKHLETNETFDWAKASSEINKKYESDLELYNVTIDNQYNFYGNLTTLSETIAFKSLDNLTPQEKEEVLNALNETVTFLNMNKNKTDNERALVINLSNLSSAIANDQFTEEYLDNVKTLLLSSLLEEKTMTSQIIYQYEIARDQLKYSYMEKMDDFDELSDFSNLYDQCQFDENGDVIKSATISYDSDTNTVTINGVTYKNYIDYDDPNTIFEDGRVVKADHAYAMVDKLTLTYLYLNGLLDFTNGGEYSGILPSEYAARNVGLMTEEEVKTYHYLYEKYGLSRAEDYFSTLEDSLNQRKGFQDAIEYFNSLEGKNYAEKLASLHLTGIRDGVVNFAQGMDNIIFSDGILSAEQYEQMWLLQILNGNVDIESFAEADKDIVKHLTEQYESTGKSLGFSYQVGSTVGNMLPSMALSFVITPLAGSTVASATSSVLIGASTFGNTKNQALHDGYTIKSANTQAFFSALAEGGLEFALGNIPGISKESSNTIVGFIKEGGEECLQEFAGMCISMANGEYISFDQFKETEFQTFVMSAIVSAEMNGINTTVSFAGNTIVLSADKINQICSEQGVAGVEAYIREKIVTSSATDLNDTNVTSTNATIDILNDINTDINIEGTNENVDINSTDIKIGNINQTNNTSGLEIKYETDKSSVQKVLDKLVDKLGLGYLNINTKGISNIVSPIIEKTVSIGTLVGTWNFAPVFFGLFATTGSMFFTSRYYEKSVKTNTDIYNICKQDGLYHFTSVDTVQKILDSGYIRATDEKNMKFMYDHGKSYMFAGLPNMEMLYDNLLGRFSPVMAALHIKPSNEQINTLNYRILDNAITYKGDFQFNQEQVEIVYFRLTNENGKFVYKQIQDYPNNFEQYLKNNKIKVPSVYRGFIETMKYEYTHYPKVILSLVNDFKTAFFNKKAQINNVSENNDINVDNNSLNGNNDTSIGSSIKTSINNLNSEINNKTDAVIGEIAYNNMTIEGINSKLKAINPEFEHNGDAKSFVDDLYLNLQHTLFYGTNQGILKAMYSEGLEIFSVQIKKLNDYIAKQLPGISSENLFKILSGIDGKLTGGVCSYAPEVNALINYFVDKQDLFKQKFGFDLFYERIGTKTGKKYIELDQARLLADLFIFANKTNYNSYGVNPNFTYLNNEWIYESNGSGNATAVDQVFAAHDFKCAEGESLDCVPLIAYFKEKGLDLDVKFNSLYKPSYTQDKVSVESLKNSVQSKLDANQTIYMDVNKGATNGIYVYNTANPTVDNDNVYVWTGKSEFADNKLSGHAMTITGITDNGMFIVDTWGMRKYISIEEFINNNAGGISSIEISDKIENPKLHEFYVKNKLCINENILVNTILNNDPNCSYETLQGLLDISRKTDILDNWLISFYESHHRLLNKSEIGYLDKVSHLESWALKNKLSQDLNKNDIILSDEIVKLASDIYKREDYVLQDYFWENDNYLKFTDIDFEIINKIPGKNSTKMIVNLLENSDISKESVLDLVNLCNNDKDLSNNYLYLLDNNVSYDKIIADLNLLYETKTKKLLSEESIKSIAKDYRGTKYDKQISVKIQEQIDFESRLDFRDSKGYKLLIENYNYKCINLDNISKTDFTRLCDVIDNKLNNDNNRYEQIINIYLRKSKISEININNAIDFIQNELIIPENYDGSMVNSLRTLFNTRNDISFKQITKIVEDFYNIDTGQGHQAMESVFKKFMNYSNNLEVDESIVIKLTNEMKDIYLNKIPQYQMTDYQINRILITYFETNDYTPDMFDKWCEKLNVKRVDQEVKASLNQDMDDDSAKIQQQKNRLKELEQIRNSTYNANEMPLSNKPDLREAQEKLIKGVELSFKDKLILGRDHPIKNIDGYELKPNCVYRAISEELYNEYLEKGYIYGYDINDEYQEYTENGQTYNNNKGVDWYLGGVDLKYGTVIIECPASKEYFIPAFDNGSGMALDPTVRHMKSSGFKKPVPMSMVRLIKHPNIKIDINELNNSDIVKNAFEIDKEYFKLKNIVDIKTTDENVFLKTELNRLLELRKSNPNDIKLNEKIKKFNEAITNIESKKQKITDITGQSIYELASQKVTEIDIPPKILEQAEYQAIEILKNAQLVEKQITKDMQQLESSKSSLIGEEYKLKDKDSLTRKIISDAINNTKKDITDLSFADIDKAAFEIGDGLRYTLLIDEDVYKETVKSSLDELTKKGYRVVNFKNSWTKPHYKGINVSIQSPTGFLLELQFHTPYSFKTKETLTHEFYQIKRNISLSKDVQENADQIQIDYQSLVDIPKDIVGYNWLTEYNEKVGKIEILEEIA